MVDEEFADLLKTLLHSPSVVGAEHSFFRVLQRELDRCGATITWYQGLLVVQGRRPESLMFSAHIDRHGLICTGPGEFQYAAFITANRSDLIDDAVSESLMQKVSMRYSDERVFAYETWSGAYRGSGVVKNAFICERRRNLVFEIDGLDHVVAGTPIAFDSRLNRSGQRFEGQLDNVLTAAALVHLFKQGFEGTAFFSAQEEAGKSWRYLLEWFRRFGASTNRLFVVDTSPFPSVEAANRQLIVLREKDTNAAFNVDATSRVAALCERHGLSYIYKDHYVEEENARLAKQGIKAKSLGSTELGRIVAASEGRVDGTTIQIPTWGYHTLKESASIEAIEAFMQLLILLNEASA